MAERPVAQRKGDAPPPASGESSARVLRGDALDVLSGLPAGFAQTCITSPPCQMSGQPDGFLTGSNDIEIAFWRHRPASVCHHGGSAPP